MSSPSSALLCFAQVQDAASKHPSPPPATPSAHDVPAKKANKKRKITHLQDQHHGHIPDHADGPDAADPPHTPAAKKAKKKGQKHNKAGRVTDIDGGSNTEEARSPERAGWHGSFPAAATAATAAADGAKKPKKKGKKAKKEGAE